MDKKYLVVFGIYLLFMFCAIGGLVIVVPSWWTRVLLSMIMILIVFLLRYIKKFLSSL